MSSAPQMRGVWWGNAAGDCCNVLRTGWGVFINTPSLCKHPVGEGIHENRGLRPRQSGLGYREGGITGVMPKRGACHDDNRMSIEKLQTLQGLVTSTVADDTRNLPGSETAYTQRIPIRTPPFSALH